MNTAIYYIGIPTAVYCCIFILATKNNEMFCRVQARTPINCPVSYLLGEPAEISEISFITNSFELEREAREPRARSASSVVEARAKREKRAQRAPRAAQAARAPRAAQLDRARSAR